jgi:hypothetical protein
LEVNHILVNMSTSFCDTVNGNWCIFMLANRLKEFPSVTLKQQQGLSLTFLKTDCTWNKTDALENTDDNQLFRYIETGNTRGSKNACHQYVDLYPMDRHDLPTMCSVMHFV